MKTSVEADADTMPAADDFSVELGPKGSLNILHFKGRPVVPMQGSTVEAQFTLSDRSTLVLISDNTLYQEVLTLSLIGPDLRERDRVMVGGAYAQGFLAYAERHSPDEVAFCWHDLDLVVTVGRYWSWLSLRYRWLKLRDTMPQRAPDAHERAPKR